MTLEQDIIDVAVRYKPRKIEGAKSLTSTFKDKKIYTTKEGLIINNKGTIKGSGYVVGELGTLHSKQENYKELKTFIDNHTQARIDRSEFMSTYKEAELDGER